MRAVPRIEEFPRTADGGLVPDAVAETLEGLRRLNASLSAELKVARAAAQRPRTAPTAQNRETVEAGVNGGRIVRAAADFADELGRNAEQTARRCIDEAREQARHIVEVAERRANELNAQGHAEADATVEMARTHAADVVSRARDVARELLRSASLSDQHLEEMTKALVRAAVAPRRAPARP
jgi:vacuolar-type H+-ATPase subunit H